MRLYLAIAVLMLALVAYTEAQEETIEQKISKFTEQMSQLGQNLGEGFRAYFDNFQNSDILAKSKEHANDFAEWVKARFQ